MTTEQLGLIVLYIAVPAANLFPFLYIIAAPWSRSWAGRAVVVSKLGLAVLVDAALLFHVLGSDYPGRAQVTLFAFSLITVGTYLYLFAFTREQLRRSKDRRA